MRTEADKNENGVVARLEEALEKELGLDDDRGEKLKISMGFEKVLKAFDGNQPSRV